MGAMVVLGLRPDIDPQPRPPAYPGNDASLQRGLRDSERGTRQGQAAAHGAPLQRQPAIELTLHQQRQVRPPALTSRGFAPFLAQQAAQAIEREDDDRRSEAQLERGLAAYQLAAGAEATLLGPVRPTDIRL